MAQPLATAFVRIRPDTTGFKRETEAGLSRSGMAGLGRKAGVAFGVAFAAAAAGLAASVVSAGKFNAAMLKIRTQAGGTARDVKVLSDQVLKLGMYAEQGPQKLADSLYHLKSVGLDDAAAMRALKAASDLAAVGGADLEQTTNALAGAWRSGIRGANNFGQAAATVNAIVGAGNMRMQDLVDAISTGLLPAARTFGLTFKNVGASLALLTDIGMPAAEAATRLRMSLSLLGAPSVTAAAQLKTIGVTGLQLANAMRGPDGLLGALTLLKKHLDASGLSASEQAQLLSRAFGGGRSSAAILALIGHLDVLRRKQDQINAATGRYGAAVAAQRATVEAMWGRLKSVVETLSIRLGEVVLPVLVKVGNWFLDTGIPAAQKFWDQVGGPAARKSWQFLKNAWAVLSTGQPPAGPAAPRPRGVPGAPGIRGPGPSQGMGGAPLSGWEKALQAVHGWLVKVIGDIQGKLVPWLGQAWKVAAPGFRDMWTGLQEIWRAGQPVWKLLGGLVGKVIIGGLVGLAGAIRIIGFVFKNVVAPATAAFFKMTSRAITVLTAAWGNLCTDFRVSWRNLTHWLGAAWSALWNAAKALLRGFVMSVLNLLGGIVHGAAVAFGWIPGLGGKLRAADQAFQRFRDRVNSALGGINGRTVDVGVKFSLGVPGHRVAAKGLYVRDGTTPTADDVLIAASKGELVVPANLVKAGAVDHLRGRIPGFAKGGQVGQGVQVRAELPAQSVINSTVNSAVVALAKQWAKSAAAAVGAIGGKSASAIVRDAMSWIGKIPYVWGGTAVPGGADCSGFVQTIYRRHGIIAPRTSESQGAWVLRTGPVPGGLAFYNSPAGGPPPGHVAIVGDRGMVISQGGGMGPQYVPLRSMPLMFTGVPPGALGKGKIGQISRFGAGGLITEPVLGIGRSGRPYSFGERGTERVTPGAGPAGDLGPLLARLDRLIAATEKAPARTAAGVGEALNRTGRRAAYSGGYS